MKNFSVLVLFVILTTTYYVNAKPFLGINTNIPVPMGPPIQLPQLPPRAATPEPNPTEDKTESSKEVETMEKSESLYYGYYPYYYGWPYYGYRYPLLYIG